MSKIGAFLSLLMAMTQSAPFIPAANCTAPEIPIVTISLGFTVLPLSPICCLASNHPFSINGLVPRYEQVSSHINSAYTAIKEIQEQFNEEAVGGAYYCRFPSFIDCYRILKRLSARNGQAVFLVCCSITDNQGKRLERGDKGLDNTSVLMKSIESTLRVGDIYTKSGDNQFLILLSGAPIIILSADPLSHPYAVPLGLPIKTRTVCLLPVNILLNF